MKKLLLILLFLGVSLSAHAATITVCASGCDQTTIAAAYTAASSNDIISVGDGTWSEDLVFNANKNITMQSTSGIAANVVIQRNTGVANNILHTDGNVTLANLTFDGTGLTTGNKGAVHTQASGDNLTMTNVVVQNVTQPTHGIYNITGTNGVITLTGVTCTSCGLSAVTLNSVTTTLIIDSSTLSPDSDQFHGLSIINNLTTVTIRNGTTLTGGTGGHGFILSGNKTITTMSVTDSTINGGTGGNDAFHLDTGDTITLLTITDSTLTDNGTSGTHNALEIGGTLTTLNATGTTFTAATGGTAVNGYDGTNYGTGTWIQVKDSTLTSPNSTALLLQKNYGQVDIEGNTINCGDSTAGCVLLGTETVEAGAENDAPLGILRFVGNKITKTGTQGHNALFGSGSGRGVIEGNTFIGGNYGLITKWDYQEIRHNKIYQGGTTVIGLFVAGGQYNKLTNNSVYVTNGHACEINDNQLTDVGKENIFRGNICVTLSATASALTMGNVDTTDADDNQIDNNVYYAPSSSAPFRILGTDYATFALYQAGWAAKYPNELFSLNDANSVWGDPRFLNPSVGDFRIPFGSPAMGTKNPANLATTVWNDKGAMQTKGGSSDGFRR